MVVEKVNDGLILYALCWVLEAEQPDLGDLTVTFESFEKAMFAGTDVITQRTVRKHWKRMISEGTLTLLDDGTCTISAEVLANNRIRPTRLAVWDCMERYPDGFTLDIVLESGASNRHSARRVLDDMCSKGLLKKIRREGVVFKPVCEG